MKLIRVLMTRNGKLINFSTVEKEIFSICKRYHINLLYVFGSYATGKTTSLSDLDIAFYSEKKVNQIELLQTLQHLFQEEAIDLVNLEKAPSHLIHRILRDGKCLFASDIKIKISFETEKENEYFDSRWMRQDYFKAMKKRIEHGTYGT